MSDSASDRSSSSIGFTMAPIVAAWDVCNDNTLHVVGATYGDNLQAVLDGSNHGDDITGTVKVSKYVSVTIPINFYVFEFDGVEQRQYTVSVSDRSGMFASVSLHIDSCQGSAVLHEPYGVYVKDGISLTVDAPEIPSRDKVPEPTASNLHTREPEGVTVSDGNLTTSETLADAEEDMIDRIYAPDGDTLHQTHAETGDSSVSPADQHTGTEIPLVEETNQHRPSVSPTDQHRRLDTAHARPDASRYVADVSARDLIGPVGTDLSTWLPYLALLTLCVAALAGVLWIRRSEPHLKVAVTASPWNVPLSPPSDPVDRLIDVTETASPSNVPPSSSPAFLLGSTGILRQQNPTLGHIRRPQTTSGILDIEKQIKKLQDDLTRLQKSTQVFGALHVIAYCARCKQSRKMSGPVRTAMKNGRPAVRGVCPTCGAKMFRAGRM